MPKEKINNVQRVPACESNLGVTQGPAPQQIEATPAVLHVNWHREGEWVQVALEGDRTYFQFAAENPDGETSARSSVYSPPLTREELNKLIRVLRRARDQVFASDE